METVTNPGTLHPLGTKAHRYLSEVLTHSKDIFLYWVTYPRQHRRNERADQLEKEAALLYRKKPNRRVEPWKPVGPHRLPHGSILPRRTSCRRKSEPRACHANADGTWGGRFSQYLKYLKRFQESGESVMYLRSSPGPDSCAHYFWTLWTEQYLRVQLMEKENFLIRNTDTLEKFLHFAESICNWIFI